MTFKEIQEKLKKCELALNSIKNGSYINGKYTKEQALEKYSTIKESLERKLHIITEEEGESMFVSTKGGDTKLVKMSQRAAMDAKKDPTITGITTTKGRDLKEDDLSDEEQEEITTETSHTEVVAKEVHKALIEALQETGHEVSEDKLSSLNPETFTITVRFKDNTQSDYSFEFIAGEVKLEGNIIVTTNKKGVTPILNKTIAKDNLVKYFKNLSEADVEQKFDKRGKPTHLSSKLSDKDRATLKKIEALLAKEKNEVVAEAYKPKHFDICPGAEALRDELLKGGKTEDDLSKWTELNDQLFALEKKVLKDKEAKESDVKKAEDLRSQIINISRELGIAAAKVGYLKGHVDKIKKHSNVSEATKEEEEEFHKKLDTLVHKTFGKRKEELKEAPYQTAYVKVSRRDYKKAMSILDQNIDPTYTKMDIVDNDGDGNVIIYFNFRDREEGDFEEDVSAFIYDVVMDLRANDIEVVDASHDLDEATDRNDPVLMRARVAKMRADDMKKLDAYNKSPEGKAAARAHASVERKEAKAREIVRKLKIKRAEIEREMENDPEIEPQGGPVSDMYGDQLNKIDNAIEKAASAYNKPMDYDTAVGLRENQPTVFDDESMDALRDIILKYVEDPDDAEAAVQQVDDQGLDSLPSGLIANLERDPEFKAWYHKLHYGSDADTDYMQRRRAEDDYGRTGLEPKNFIDPEDLTPAAMAKKKLNKENIQVGHPDNEPGMLKQDAYDIAHYAVKLYKLLKYYDSLEDQVDFPHWWQSKVVKARDFISAATHYLEFKTNEPAIDTHVDALQEGRSTNAIKKEYDALVKKMIELAKEYKQAEGDKKQKLVDQLKDHTKKKKELEKELDQAVQKTGADQELDTSINELSGDQRDALYELQNILDDVAQKGEEAREIIRQSFPRMLSKADAYGAFDLGSSSNRYDTTLASIIEEIEEYYDEEEDLDEIGMFHDPIGYSSTAAAEDKRALQFVKDLINKGVNKEDAIEKAAEKFNLRVHYLTRYVDKSIDEAVTHDFEDRFAKAAIADVFQSIRNLAHTTSTSEQEAAENAIDEIKLEFGVDAMYESLNEEMDGGQLFDYFANKGYDVEERRPDGYPPKEGVEGYMVSRGNDRYPQSVIFQHNKDTDEFTISRMSGYRIDQKEAIKAGMRQAGRSGAAGMDSYMTDGNYTPVDISAEGLKDIVDHVMTGLDREASAQRDFYAARGKTSGTIDEQFKVGDKVTYLGHPGEITKVNKEMTGAITYNVLYDKGNGKTKATNIYNKDGEIVKEASRKDLGMSSSVSKRRAKAELKKPGNDGSKVFGLDKDGKRVHIKSINDVDKFKKFELDADISEGKGGQIMPGDIVKNQHGNYYMRVDGKVGGHDAYVRVINGKPGKKKTGLHDSFKLTLVNKEELKEGATCCGKCGRVHVKGTKCKRPFLTGKDHCRNN